MKLRNSLQLSILAIGVLSAHAEPVRIRDAATHEQLSQALRESQQADPMSFLPAAQGEDPAPASRPADLLSESDIISFGGLATLVPKRAILRIPDHLRERIGLHPGARLVGWSEFHALNIAWINTIEVTRTQAEGSEAIGEAGKELLRTSEKLVVATYQRGPISVLPPKPPENPKLAKS